MKRFLWFCSTANQEILEQCPTDQDKHAMIGTMVLLTALFAFLSGSFAMHYMFEGDNYATVYALGFGVLWSILIFSIDRLLIATIRKPVDAVPVKFNPKAQTALIVIRFALAIIISIVITKPLELWLYEDQINVTIIGNIDMRNQQSEEKLDKTLQIDILAEQDSIARDSIANLSNQLTSIKQDPEYVRLAQAYDNCVRRTASNIDNKKKQLRGVKNDIVTIQSYLNKTLINSSKKVSEGRRIIYSCGYVTEDGKKLMKILASNGIAKINDMSTNTCPPKMDGRIPTSADLKSKAKQYLRQKNSLKAKWQGEINNVTSSCKDESGIYLKSIKNPLEEQLEEQKDIQKTSEQKLTTNKKTKIGNMTTLRKTNEKADRGIFGRIDVLSQYNQSSWNRKLASWFILMIFLIIETAPIVAKMVSKVGPYDYKLALKEYELQEQEKHRKIIADFILQKQTEVAKKAIEDWAKQQQDALKKDSFYAFWNKKT